LMALRLGLQIRLQALNLALDELSTPLNLRLVPSDPAQRPVCGAVVRDAPGLVARDVGADGLVNLVLDIDVLKRSYHLVSPSFSCWYADPDRLTLLDDGQGGRSLG